MNFLFCIFEMSLNFRYIGYLQRKNCLTKRHPQRVSTNCHGLVLSPGITLIPPHAVIFLYGAFCPIKEIWIGNGCIIRICGPRCMDLLLRVNCNEAVYSCPPSV